MKRTGYCGAFRRGNVGEKATVMGWVQTKRDMGGVIFVDVRDREGVLQVVFNAAHVNKEGFALAEMLHNEAVVRVSGEIALRDAETYNPSIATGEVELRATDAELLSEAQGLPFPIENDTAVREDLRLKYRFLDIRRPRMLENLRYRHKVVRAVRDYLDDDGFIEVETPMLTKSTPEGARDYLVPSRVHPGTFYALPQSPQIFKQLLMVGGVDKYYQVARCFRDEDLRSDRQPEFTQVDMELSFIEQEDILQYLEKLFKHIFRSVMGKEMTEPFPRLTWKEAMDSYGSDKPDLRFGLPIIDISEIARTCSFSVFRNVIDGGGVVRAINVKGGAEFTRSTIEELTRRAQHHGAKGMAWIAIRPDGEIYSILTKYFKPEEITAILQAMDGQPGDFILFCADTLTVVRRTLGNLRLELGDMLELRNTGEYKFLVVTDFPQFEYSQEEGRFMAMHHPFTMPYEEDIPYLIIDPGRVRAQAYDIVLNGIELGSGSIRIHRRDVQQKMFEALGFDQETIENRFGFLVNAFRYGTPPHGGFAFGLDRLVMMMLGAESLRDVIAFPKIKDASCLLTGAPDVVDADQLEILGISTTAEEEKPTGKPGAHRQVSVNIDVDNVANLSQLTLSTEEKQRMKSELEAMIAFADQLGELNTEGVPITAHVLPMENVFRDDTGKPSFDRDELLSNAPTRQDGYIHVPKVVE